MSTPGRLKPYPPDMNIWHAPPGYDGRAADPEFARLSDALRRLQDSFTGAAPTPSASSEAAGVIERATELLDTFTVPEVEQIAGRRLDLPGRGQTLAPVFDVDNWDRDSVRGRVTFGRFYLGGNGAVHGGAIPLLFDDALGRLASSAGRKRARTAYLHVNFRSITPVGKELVLAARFVSEVGRKRLLTGEILDNATLCAEAEGLFVELRPGQP